MAAECKRDICIFKGLIIHRQHTHSSYQCLGQGQMLTRCAISSFVGLHPGLRPWRAETLILALTLCSFLIRGNVLNLYLTPFLHILKNDCTAGNFK